jgi:hypothetical protein
VTGPGSPSPTVTSPPVCFTVPIGVITAAVPQPNTSVSTPEAAPPSHSCPEMGRSTTLMPRSRATVISESRVIPASTESRSSGVASSRLPSTPRKTKNRLFEPISSIQVRSSASR